MPDISPATLALAALAGVGLGAFYFGGLWWTVRRASAFRRPVLAMLASLIVRLAVALGGFYLVAGGSWQRMLLCLGGFIVARAAMSRQVRHDAPVAASGAFHAP